MDAVSRRTFHRNALGTLFTVAGAILIVRALCGWSNEWSLLVAQVLAGSVMGGGIARRSYPELRAFDAAVASALAAVFVVGIGYIKYATPPLPELVVSVVLATVCVGATVRFARRYDGPEPGRFIRALHGATVVWSAAMVSLAVMLRVYPSSEDAFLAMCALVGGAVAVLVVPSARPWEVALGLAISIVVTLPLMTLIHDGPRHLEIMVFIAIAAAIIAGGLTLLGAGIGLIFRYRPALSDVELVPKARVER